MHCTHVLTVTETTCMRPTENQSKYHPIRDRGGVPCISEALLAMYSLWERKSPFSARIQILWGYLCFSRWSYIHTHTGSSKGSPWVSKEREKTHALRVNEEERTWSWEGKVARIGEELEGMGLIQRYQMHVLILAVYKKNWKIIKRKKTILCNSLTQEKQGFSLQAFFLFSFVVKRLRRKLD